MWPTIVSPIFDSCLHTLVVFFFFLYVFCLFSVFIFVYI